MLTSTRTVAVVFPRWLASFEHDHANHRHAHHRHAQPDDTGDREIDAAHRGFEPIVRELSTISPLVHVHAAGIALFAARGPSRYFGGDTVLATLVHNTVAAACVAHLTGRADIDSDQGWGVGIADGRVAALVAARRAVRHGAPVVVPVGESVGFLSTCPVSVLEHDGDIPADTAGVFPRLGLPTLGAVAGLSEAELIDRFGAIGEQVYRIVNGFDVHMLVPELPPPDFIRQHAFEEPVATSTIVLAAVHDTCADLVVSLEARALQCVRLHVLVESDHGERNERMWHQPRGFTTHGILERLRWQLDGWLVSDDDVVTAGIVRVQLVPVDVRLLDAEQQGLWGGRREHDERAFRAVTQALAVHPDVSVTVPEWRGGRDIAQVFAQVAVVGVDLRDRAACVRRVTSGNGVPEQWSGALPTPSPSTVYTKPLPVQLRDAHGNDVVVSGRHELANTPVVVSFDTADHRVLSWAGPWPVEERWWDPRRHRRMARLQVLVENSRTRAQLVLLLVVENKRWSVAAMYN